MSTTDAGLGGIEEIGEPELTRDPYPITDASTSRLLNFEAAGHDPVAAARLCEQLYGDARFSVVPSDVPFVFRCAARGDLDVSVRVGSSTGLLHGDVERTTDYMVTWFRDSEAFMTLDGSRRVVAPGQPVVLPAASPFAIDSGTGRQSLVHVARSFLDRLATERHGGEVQPVTFHHERVIDAESEARWRDAISVASPAITDAASTPLLRMEANASVGRALLTVFPWVTRTVPPALLRPRLARVRAAVDFLHENAHRPITPADAATAVGLQTRSLQNSFQRHLDCSPTEYLRRLRLDRVRRDLVEHTPATATVSDIARAWGFGNLGRFAATYRDRFGEMPKETLRR